ncbi:lipoate--protein ligase family protein [Alloscardovia criceti]|uniref:lipoate--protein ligase family protein n=1 Tax=Alloscardovia criceti TaxID=356828 RepID=UPI00036F1770|nr:lipoate--protein ligase family protein [Alloscardovia criceti]
MQEFDKHNQELSDNTLRGEYKVPGGKLVAVQLSTHSGHITRLSLDGDFFIDGVDDPTQVVNYLENQLLAVSATAAMKQTQQAFHHAQFVGLTAQAIDTAIERALHSRSGEPSYTTEITSAPAATTVTPVSRATEEKITQLSPAWSAYDIAVLSDDTPQSPAMHMALDEVLAQQVADGKRGPTLRFWQWAHSAVVIGLHQSVSNEVDVQRARELDIDVVRRMTGGGAMFIEPGNTITYSLYIPRDFLEGLQGYEAYKRCDEWVLLALNNLGIDAHYKAINDITSPAGKIGGAAQRQFRPSAGSRGPGCVLHHVTMAYDIDASKMLEVLRISREKSADKAVKSAAKRVDPLKSQTMLSRDEMVQALRGEALDILPHSHADTVDAATQSQAQTLAKSKYSTTEWTYAIR